MCRRTLLVFSLLCVFALLHSRAAAQDYLSGTGTQTWGINLPIGDGFINVANGNVHIEIPLASAPQRGSVPLGESLVYDSRIWGIAATGSSYAWTPSNVPGGLAGWQFLSGPKAGVVYQDYIYLSNSYLFRYRDQTNAVHKFGFSTAAPSCNGCGQPTAASGYALDGSGYFMSVTNSTVAVVFDANGNEVYPNVIDRNGNSFSTDASGNITDTVGRTPLKVSISGNQTFYDVLTVGGATKRYTITVAFQIICRIVVTLFDVVLSR